MTQIHRAFDGAMLTALLLAVPLCFAYLGLSRRAQIAKGRAVTEALLVLSVVCVLAVTLLPTPGIEDRALEWVPFTDVDSEARRAQIALNAALMFPTGFLAALLLARRASLRRMASAAFAFPFIIEAAQFGFPLGRVSAVEDLILGAFGLTAGGLLGLAFAPRLHLLDRPHPETQATQSGAPSAIEV